MFMFTKSQDSPATEFSNALVPGKKVYETGRSDCSFNKEILASSFNRIFTDVCYACIKEKEIQHR